MKATLSITLIVGLFTSWIEASLADEGITPLDIQFKRQAVRRLVFDEGDSIPLSSCRPAEIVNLSTEYPSIAISENSCTYKVDKHRLRITAEEVAESALWMGGFNPFATYDISFSGEAGSNSGVVGVEFASPDNQNRVEVVANLDSGVCHSLRWQAVIDGAQKESKKIELKTPVRGSFKLRVQVLGTGLNIFLVQKGVNRIVSTHDFSKLIDLRRKENIRSLEFRLLSRMEPGDQIHIDGIGASLTTGAGQADICNITNEDGSPFIERGRLWFTMSVRGRHLPHPLQGVFSLNPSVFDVRFEGIIVFDRNDGLLRNEIASHIFYDRNEKEWRGLTVGFSSYGDPEKKVPKQLWAVSSKRDPRFGYSIMKAETIDMPGAEEDPHIIYDAEAGKWRVLVCTKGGAGFPATLYEADHWNGPYKLIAGPATVNGTGCLLQKIGSSYYAIFGSAERKFYVYSYPQLEPMGQLDMIRPPWGAKDNTRCWPNVIPLPDGYPSPYIALSMDRANYTGLKGWTYGALYLYHGHSELKTRTEYEYAPNDQ